MQSVAVMLNRWISVRNNERPSMTGLFFYVIKQGHLLPCFTPVFRRHIYMKSCLHIDMSSKIYLFFYLVST